MTALKNAPELTFATLGVRDEIVRALAEKGIEKPFAIQELTLPLALDGEDEMLDLGFLPDIERILRQIPADRQSMLFSATMPDPIITLARTFMVQPTHIRAEAPHSLAVHDTTEQFVYRAHALDKVE